MDMLSLLRGVGYPVNEHLTIRHPRVGEICDYGEHEYYALVSMLTATPSDLMVQLTDMGIDYEAVDEFQLFATCCGAFSPERTRILLGDFDLSALRAGVHPATGEFVLVHPEKGFFFDKAVYEIFVGVLRQMHGMKKNSEHAGNATTKQIMIDEARRRMERQAGKPPPLFLPPILSALTNSPEFKYGFRDVWDMPIYTLMDAVRRIQTIRNYQFIMSGVYSGNVDIKKVSRKELDWLSEL